MNTTVKNKDEKKRQKTFFSASIVIHKNVLSLMLFIDTSFIFFSKQYMIRFLMEFGLIENFSSLFLFVFTFIRFDFDTSRLNKGFERAKRNLNLSKL